jgi:Flp pilus assembly protein TadG
MVFLKRFFEDERGNFATVFGVLAAAFSVAIAMAVQVSGLSHARSNLQEVVDAAVIAAAKEAQLANFNRTVAQGVAEDFVLSNMSGRMHEAKVETVVKSGLRSYATQFARTEITVNAAVKVAHPLWSTGGNTVTMQASATARIRSAGKMCVIVLEDSEQGALSLTTRARMTATDCAVYSNSVSRAGIVTANHVRLDSRFVCTAGGFKGRLTHYTSKPLTDCPQTPDPLAGRKPPAVGACLAANSNVIDYQGVHTLKPGTYCGGLTIKGKAEVTLAPGEYVFKDGPLVVAGSATLRGEYVGLYFTGKDAVAEFGIASRQSISAPHHAPRAQSFQFPRGIDLHRQARRPLRVGAADAHVFIDPVLLAEQLDEGRAVAPALVPGRQRLGRPDDGADNGARGRVYHLVAQLPLRVVKSDRGHRRLHLQPGLGRSCVAAVWTMAAKHGSIKRIDLSSSFKKIEDRNRHERAAEIRHRRQSALA